MNRSFFTIFLGLTFLSFSLRAQVENETKKTLPSFSPARFGPSIVIPKTEIVNKDLIAAGESVTIEGIVRGDAYIAARTVIVSGSIEGDLITAAQTLVISGNIGEDARVMAGSARIAGPIARDLVILCGDLDQSDTVGGDGFYLGGHIVNRGYVVGRGYMEGDTVELRGRMAAGATISARNVIIGPDAIVYGQLSYSSPKEAVISPQSRIGSTERYPWDPEWNERTATMDEANHNVRGLIFALKVIDLFSILITGTFLIALFKNPIREMRPVDVKGFLNDLAKGFFILAVLPAVSLVLIASIIGLPLGFMGLTVWWFSIYFSRITASIIAGSLIMEKVLNKDSLFSGLLVGALLLFALSFIPYLKGIVFLAVLFSGSGALFRLLKDLYRRTAPV